VAIQQLCSEILDTYFMKLGRSNQVTRENNREWEIRVKETGIDFAHNFDSTNNPEVDSILASVQFAASNITAS
jgi:hypothetical protein